MPSTYRKAENTPDKVVEISLEVVRESLQIYHSHSLNHGRRLSHSQILCLVKTGMLPKPAMGEKRYPLRQVVAGQVAAYEENQGRRFPDSILEEYGWKRSELEKLIESPPEPVLTIVPPQIDEESIEKGFQEIASGKSTTYSDDLRQYFSEIGRYSLLTMEEESRLAAMVRQGDIEARRMLVRSNLRLVPFVARWFENMGVELMQRIEWGNEGLLKALERFDPEQGRFSTYAAHWIKQCIRIGFIKEKKTVRVPVYMHENVYRLRKMEDEFMKNLGRLPTKDEIAVRTGWKDSTVERVIKTCEKHFSRYWMRKPCTNVVDRRNRNIPDTVWESELKGRVMDAYHRLDARSQLVLKHRFGLGCKDESLDNVGKRIGRTRERVRQIEEDALNKIKGILGLPVEKKKKRKKRKTKN